jgi:hypothetical protein
MLSAGTRLGPYEILSPLGAGGMGEVYRARDEKLGRDIAIKVLPAEVSQDAGRRQRLEQEARAASALNHPGIVTIHDIGSADGVMYVAMELVEGRTLRELLADGPLPSKKLLEVGGKAADALARAHMAGIVHRDLKPENLMVTKEGFVKILDFGLAKLSESPSRHLSLMPTAVAPPTEPGTVLGTAGYMSPEQASGQPLDFRSDQFSLGSVLYEMATGKRAFLRKTVAETLAAIIREEPEPVGQLNPRIPAPLRWIIERCLAKDPGDRYFSTGDLARDLASVREHLSEASTGAAAVFAEPLQSRRLPRALLFGGATLILGLVLGWLARTFIATTPSAPRWTRLTFRQGLLSNARFAPDGNTIVYSAQWAGDPPGMLLYRTQVGSPESAPFDFPGDITAISPSNELAILLGNQGGTLALAPMSGGKPRQILEDVTYQGADFSADGRELAVAHNVEGHPRLEFPIGNVLVPKGVRSPRVSRDGRSVAFWMQAGGFWAVAVIDRHGGPVRVLSNGWLARDGLPCWSASGREIWFSGTEPGLPSLGAIGIDSRPSAIWAVDLSGKRRLVARVPGSLELYDISRDGRTLLGHHTEAQTVRFASASNPTERNLSWLDGSSLGDLSSDGRTILLNERGEGSRSSSMIYLRGTDGSPAVKLGEGTGWALSPDGKWVLAQSPRQSGKAASLTILPTGAGQSRALEGADLADLGWGAWLPDGRSVVYSAAAKEGDWRLYIQAVPSGKPQAIGPEKVRLWPSTSPVSPDGKYVIGMRDGETLLVPLDGAAQPRALPGLSAGEHAVQWSPDSHSVYVWRPGEAPAKVSLIDIGTGMRRPWREIAVERYYGLLRITPDGNAWAYWNRRVLSELYLVEGLR